MIHSAEVGDEVPTFNLDSNMGRISFHDVIDGKWCLLMTFSNAFEPVATTDMGMLAKMMEEFESRNIFVIAIGNDTGQLHALFSVHLTHLLNQQRTDPH